jgi:hypothetical protein
LNDNETDSEPESADTSQKSQRIGDKAKPGGNGDTTIHLQWRDWIALTIASLETILLPAVAIVVVLAILILAFRVF